MQTVSKSIRHFLALITKGLLSYTFPVCVGIPNGVWYFDEGEENEQDDTRDDNGMCAGCGQYECEC